MKYKFISLLVFLLITSFNISAASLPGPLVETDWLKQNLDKVTILDVRQDTKSFTARPKYVKDKKTGKIKLSRVGSHIPGARLVNYKKIRTTRAIGNNKVTRIIPEKQDFEKLMQAVGLNKGDTVVIVSKGESNGDMTMATRLYWQLKYFGHEKMAILNGGMAQWLLDNNKISNKKAGAKKGNWTTSKQDNSILASSEDVEKASQSGNTQLVDTRNISLFAGIWNKDYVYGKGHIDGAKNYPVELITQPKLPAKFVPSNQTASILNALGIKPDKQTITYCNSGHLASGAWFLMHEVMGNKNVKLYDGSMHQWTVEKRPTKTLTGQ